MSPLAHSSVISSRDCRYPTTQAATICRCSEGQGSITSCRSVSDVFLFGIGLRCCSLLISVDCRTIAATPPETRSTQSIPASAIAAEATVIHPDRIVIIPQLPKAPRSAPSPHHRSSSPSSTVTIISTPLFGHRSPMMTPRSAVSRCTARSRSPASRR